MADRATHIRTATLTTEWVLIVAITTLRCFFGRNWLFIVRVDLESALDNVWRGWKIAHCTLMHITHVNLESCRRSHDLIMSLLSCLYFLMLAPDPLLNAVKYSFLLRYLLLAVFHSLCIKLLGQLLLICEGAAMHDYFFIYVSELSV